MDHDPSLDAKQRLLLLVRIRRRWPNAALAAVTRRRTAASSKLSYVIGLFTYWERALLPQSCKTNVLVALMHFKKVSVHFLHLTAPRLKQDLGFVIINVKACLGECRQQLLNYFQRRMETLSGLNCIMETCIVCIVVEHLVCVIPTCLAQLFT